MKQKGVKEKWVGEIKWHVLPERRRLKSTYDELMQQFIKENPLVIDDEIEDRFSEWLSERK